MSISDKLKKILHDNFIVKLVKSIQLPGLSGTTLYDLIVILLKGVSNQIFGLRVSAVAWAFFFSVFPFLLFLFSVLPYAPLYHEIKTLLFSEFIPRILPERITNEVVDYVSNTATGAGKKNLGYLFILLSIFLSSNGITVLIKGFNTSEYGYAKRRKGINTRLVSIGLTLLFVVLIIAQLIFTYYTQFIWLYIEESNNFLKVPMMVQFLNFLSASLFYFTSLILLYVYGTNIKQRIRNVVPGALMATVLFFITLLGFQFYIKKFNHYDLLYGSVGLVMILMLFIYINVLLIMVGFELNASIYQAKLHKKNQPEQINSMN